MYDIWLYLFGALGAVIYSFPVYIAAASLDPPGKFALAVLIFSVFVGAVLAPPLVALIAIIPKLAFLIKPEPYPLAVGLGLFANPLVPIALRRFNSWAETYKGAKP